MISSIIPINCEVVKQEEHAAIKNKRLQKFLVITTVARFTFEATQTAEHIQTLLNERRIPLNCTNPPRQTQRNHVKEEAVREFIAYTKEHLPKRYNLIKGLWEQGVSKITLEELDDNLKKCTGYLDARLKGKPYDVGFVANKSSKWIAELALVYLLEPPISFFEHGTDKGGIQSPVSQERKRFVIFDDAAYSGSQLLTIVTAFKGQLIEQNKTAKLFLVVPFISTRAKMFLENELLRNFNAPPGSASYTPERVLKVHLITSTIPVKLMSDYLPKGNNYQGITFTEWKIPDTTSLSTAVSTGEITLPDGQTKSLEFLTNYRPCYK